MLGTPSYKGSPLILGPITLEPMTLKSGEPLERALALVQPCVLHVGGESPAPKGLPYY
jgi:hypothetical protein